MAVLGLITARGGSKGIARKNIKSLAGKPLIEWTVDAANDACCIDRIVVSTEDEEIASLALKLGVDVPFMRPDEMAADDTPSITPILHAVEFLPEFDWIILLQPTSPLRSGADIDGIWRFCQEWNAPSAVSVCESDKNPYWMFKRGIDDYRLKSFIDGGTDITRRQDLPPAYALNGALYLARTAWLCERRSLIGPETLGYVMPRERSLDLDTPFDWLVADLLMRTL